MLVINLYNVLARREQFETKMTTKEMPFIMGMILLDIVASIFLMIGLIITTSLNASPLNNFQIVGNSLIALFLFKDNIRTEWFFRTFKYDLICINDTIHLSR